MAVLFISHSSKDDALATAVEAWLKVNGFTDIFVDHHAIAGGDKWRDMLRQSAHSCRVVVCIVTGNWLASSECFNEFMAAWYMGRRIIPLLLLPRGSNLTPEIKQRLDRVLGEDQGIDLSPCLDAGDVLEVARDEGVAARLKSGLRAAGANTRVGLDPEAFAIDRKLREHPFPGLASFGDEDADAALFYGRSREIADTLIDLRKMRAERDLRPYVILGASGAGKSSLLKAGIIPRLRRETPAWLPLRAFRPGADPLLNLAEAIAHTLADFGQREAHGLVRDRLLEVWSQADRGDGTLLSEAGRAAIAAALEAEGQRLRTAANRPGATILVSVDQAEEMARAESRSGEALADYLRAALTSEHSPWQLAFTIRTDSFPELQKHRRFQQLEMRGYDLRAIPVFRFESVVQEPAKRYGVEVDPGLVDALMEDAPKDDAMPLLAFALQRLWRQYGASGALTEQHYRNVGGLKGLIEDAAERALRGIDPGHDVPLPQKEPASRVLVLGRATFVPPMVQINEQGATIRRVPAWNSFSEDAQELLARFDAWRLVVRKGQDEADGGTVEVAHEALFREWNRLKEWLEPERARLEAFRCLQVDAAAWKRRGRDGAFLNHREARLSEAVELEADPGFAGQMVEDERAYLAACRADERRRQTKARRGKVLVGLLGLLLGAGAVGWWKQDVLNEQYHWRLVMGPQVLAVEAEKQKAASPGADFKECANGCPMMVVVPAGTFKMGSPEGQGDSDERPQRDVTISRPFAVGRTEVTFAEWDVCVKAGACAKISDNGWGRDDRPAILMSWEEAKQYVDWLKRMTGKDYRLLTEAEWEYAARARTTTRWSFGDDEKQLGEHAWFSENSQSRTHPVAGKKPNAFGLYDMHGNVWEWTADHWHDNYRGAPPDGTAWTEGGDASRRVVRGGSWYVRPGNLRSADRSRSTTGDRGDDLGFRVGRTLTP